MNKLLVKAFEMIAEELAKEAIKQGSSSIWKAIGEGIKKLKGECEKDGVKEPKVTFNVEGDAVINCTIVLNDGTKEVSATRGLMNIKEIPNQVKLIEAQPTEYEYNLAKGKFIANIEKYLQEVIDNGDLTMEGVNWNLTDKWQEMTGKCDEYVYIYMEDGCKYEIADSENTIWFSGRFSDEMSLKIFEELEGNLRLIENNSEIIDLEENNWIEEQDDSDLDVMEL